MKNKIKYLLVVSVALLSVVSFFPRALVPVAYAGDASSTPNTTATNTYVQEQNKTEVNQRILDKNQPLPAVTQSLERANLIERLKRFNEPTKISYIYLVSYGKVMAFYTIKGKVSSVDSYLSNPSQLITKMGNPCNGTYSDDSGKDCYQVESPDMDGSYGTNGTGIFFFTTASTYVEWNGEYMLADQPLQLSTAPELTMIVK